MKQNIRKITLIAILFMSATSVAETVASKSALRVNFNKMIEDNNNKRQDLHQDLDKTPQAATKKDDKGKAIDFIDVEIGVGQAPSVVDRRFDSVGAPRLAEPETLLIQN